MKRILFIVMLVLFSATNIWAKSKSPIKVVEPPCWWVGLETPLQLMFYGEELNSYTVSLKEQGQGVEITKIDKADSPSYLFVDVKIGAEAKAGEYIFEFVKGRKKFEYKYAIKERTEGSAERASYDSKDLIYLIMPDRFANGDPTNDNTEDTSEKIDRSEAFGRHGGDLQGIINNLDYIADLGATAIWCTPLLLDNEPTGSYHGYACSDYYTIDPRFGTNDLFKHYVEEAHKRGLKVIMDVVTNHCGIAHWWMKDLPFKNWVNNTDSLVISTHAMSAHLDPNASQYDLAMHEKGWFVDSMPDMNFDNPYVLQYFKQWAVWWVEWSGLDGYRVDTYPYNEKIPMSEWCKSVIDEFPNITIMGECWIGSKAQLAYWDGGAVNKDGFNSNLPMVMDFPLRDAMIEGLNKDNPGWGEGPTKIYDAISHDFLFEDPRTLLIFMGNHDTARMLDILNGDVDRVKLATAMLATMRGVPQIYAGDELAFASPNRENISSHGELRIDTPGGWEGDEVNLFNPEERNEVQREIFDYSRKLFQWRKTATVVHEGKTMHFLSRDNTYCYFRYTDDKALMVFINNSADSRTINWANYAEITKGLTSGKDIISDKMITVGAETIVPGKTAMVVEFDR